MEKATETKIVKNIKVGSTVYVYMSHTLEIQCQLKVLNSIFPAFWRRKKLSGNGARAHCYQSLWPKNDASIWQFYFQKYTTKDGNDFCSYFTKTNCSYRCIEGDLFKSGVLVIVARCLAFSVTIKTVMSLFYVEFYHIVCGVEMLC